MQIFVKYFTGKIININVKKDDNIENLKLKINEEEGIPANKQRLIFNGIDLKDQKTCSHYKIKEESFLNLVVKLKKENEDKKDYSFSDSLSCAIF